MNEAYLISGLMRLVRLLAKARKKNKTKQINKMIEKGKEIQKRIYSIKPKIT